MKKVGQDSRCLGRFLNRRHPEYGRGLLDIPSFNIIHYLVATVIAVIVTSCSCANNLHLEALKYLIHIN